MKISNYQEREDGVKVQNDSTHDDGKGERGGGGVGAGLGR